jgi:DNA-binding response OmpR family regulator
VGDQTGGLRGRVLVVDDDPHIREICRLYLAQAGFQVEEAADGEAALARIAAAPPDLVVLDILLPGRDGIHVLGAIRARDEWLPVLLLTALGDEDQRVRGLRLGADDYLTKPFSPRELVARAEAILRRARLAAPRAVDAAPVLEVPGLIVDQARRQAWRSGELLALTPREFDLLGFLVSHPGRVWTRSQLLEQVWGFDFEGDERTVDVHITRLRAKLEGRRDYRYIHTVWGVGYRFAVEAV